MPVYTKIGDTVIGDKIIVEARKISEITVIVKTGKHKSQRAVLKDNTKCVIDKKAKFIKD
jgi:hypothetical protein